MKKKIREIFFGPTQTRPVVDWLQWNIPRRAGEGVRESRESLSDVRKRRLLVALCAFYCWCSVVCSEMWRAGGRWLGSAVDFVSRRWSRASWSSPFGRDAGQTAKPTTDMPQDAAASRASQALIVASSAFLVLSPF